MYILLPHCDPTPDLTLSATLQRRPHTRSDTDPCGLSDVRHLAGRLSSGERLTPSHRTMPTGSIRKGLVDRTELSTISAPARFLAGPVPTPSFKDRGGSAGERPRWSREGVIRLVGFGPWSLAAVSGCVVGLGPNWLAGVSCCRSKSRQTSRTCFASTGRRPTANALSKALSQITLMSRGIPRDAW